MSAIKELINWLCDPRLVFAGAVAGLVLALRFRQALVRPVVALPIAIGVLAFYFISFTDPEFIKIATKADNIPIAGMFFLIGFFLWWAFSQAVANDKRLERGEPPNEGTESEREGDFSWPFLIYSEMLAVIIAMTVLLVWSIVIEAPLEQPADPSIAPNPSKAPWYFLGLQEMLVYYDPWLAGVVFPSMIISGLMIIPYVDMNPRGSGYYTFKERPFAISFFLFGFLVMWVLVIGIGTFFRGPNWNFFGIFEYWDVHKLEALTNVNISEYFWVSMLGKTPPSAWYLRELPGFTMIGAYFVIGPYLGMRLFPRFFAQFGTGYAGFLRYSMFISHFLMLAALPIKMVLRWTINLKYIVFIPEFFFNI